MRRQSAIGMTLAVLLCAAAHAGLFRQVRGRWPADLRGLLAAMTPKIRMHLFAPGCPGKDAT